MHLDDGNNLLFLFIDITFDVFHRKSNLIWSLRSLLVRDAGSDSAV